MNVVAFYSLEFKYEYVLRVESATHLPMLEIKIESEGIHSPFFDVK